VGGGGEVTGGGWGNISKGGKGPQEIDHEND